MIVVAISDTHGDVGVLEPFAGAFEAADVVLITGDLTTFGGRREAARVVEAVRRHNPTVLAIAGNCDYFDVDGYLEKEGISLHGSSRVLNGV